MKFKILFAIGAVILIIGFIVQWYPTSIIGGLEERLDDSDITVDESNKLQGALNSWKVHQITSFTPISNILIIVGIIVIVYAVVSGSFDIVTEYKIVKKTE